MSNSSDLAPVGKDGSIGTRAWALSSTNSDDGDDDDIVALLDATVPPKAKKTVTFKSNLLESPNRGVTAGSPKEASRASARSADALYSTGLTANKRKDQAKGTGYSMEKLLELTDGYGDAHKLDEGVGVNEAPISYTPSTGQARRSRRSGSSAPKSVYSQPRLSNAKEGEIRQTNHRAEHVDRKGVDSNSKPRQVVTKGPVANSRKSSPSLASGEDASSRSTYSHNESESSPTLNASFNDLQANNTKKFPEREAAIARHERELKSTSFKKNFLVNNNTSEVSKRTAEQHITNENIKKEQAKSNVLPKEATEKRATVFTNQQESYCQHTSAQLVTLQEQSLHSTQQNAHLLSSVSDQVRNMAETLTTLEIRLAEKQPVPLEKEKAQLEAREMLTAEMEPSAKHRREQKESETDRLDAAIKRIEEMTRDLQSQNEEERERLKNEHVRLSSLQDTFTKEREASVTLHSNEKEQIQSTWARYDAEKRKLEADITKKIEELERSRAALGEERAQFARQKAESVRAAESQMTAIKHEQEKLNLDRQALERDVALFEQRQEIANNILLNAENVRQELDAKEKKVEEYASKVETMGQDVSRAGSVVTEREAEADKKLVLAERFRQEGDLAHQAAAEERDEIERDRAKLTAEARKVEEDRMTIARERLNLLRRRSSTTVSNYSFGTKLDKTTGEVNQLSLQPDHVQEVDENLTGFGDISPAVLASVQFQLSMLDTEDFQGDHFNYLAGEDTFMNGMHKFVI